MVIAHYYCKTATSARRHTMSSNGNVACTLAQPRYDIDPMQCYETTRMTRVNVKMKLHTHT